MARNHEVTHEYRSLIDGLISRVGKGKTILRSSDQREITIHIRGGKEMKLINPNENEPFSVKSRDIVTRSDFEGRIADRFKASNAPAIYRVK